MSGRSTASSSSAVRLGVSRKQAFGGPKAAVCLIEAGSPGKSWLISMPMGVVWLMRHKKWNPNFRIEPQEALNRREIIVPPGRALDGPSAINGMVYIRGPSSDFDGWAALGWRLRRRAALLPEVGAERPPWPAVPRDRGRDADLGPRLAEPGPAAPAPTRGGS